MRHENSRFAPRSKYPWGAPRTPCKARLCATFDPIRGGLCPLELPLRKGTADPIERVYRQAERRAAGRRPFFVCPLRPRCARPPLPKGEPRVCAPLYRRIPRRREAVRPYNRLPYLRLILALSFRASDRCHWRGNPHPPSLASPSGRGGRAQRGRRGQTMTIPALSVTCGDSSPKGRAKGLCPVI